MRILHIISGLSLGGAEVSLVKLLKHLNGGRYEHSVISLTNLGPMAEEIASLGIPVEALGLSRRFPNPLHVVALAQRIRRETPDIIDAWMYHSNVAAVASRFVGRKIPIIWNIRHSLHHIRSEKSNTAFAIRIGKYLSKYADRIVYNSEVSFLQHREYGYCDARSAVIPNGFDCEMYRPLPGSRNEIRAALGLPAQSLLIGHIARYHPMKDHANMLRAAALVAGRIDNAHFIFIGHGVDSNNQEMGRLIIENGLSNRVHLLGDRNDLNKVLPAMDLVVSSSYGEGFPNVVAEAMACGVPCVVTDVGDSAAVVGDTGLVVEANDSNGLAEGIKFFATMNCENRCGFGKRARDRIKENYSIQKTVSFYKQLYSNVGLSGEDALAGSRI